MDKDIEAIHTAMMNLHTALHEFDEDVSMKFADMFGLSDHSKSDKEAVESLIDHLRTA
jgi:hypothetical protein